MGYLRTGSATEPIRFGLLHDGARGRLRELPLYDRERLGNRGLAPGELLCESAESDAPGYFEVPGRERLAKEVPLYRGEDWPTRPQRISSERYDTNPAPRVTEGRYQTADLRCPSDRLASEDSGLGDPRITEEDGELARDAQVDGLTEHNAIAPKIREYVKTFDVQHIRILGNLASPIGRRTVDLEVTNGVCRVDRHRIVNLDEQVRVLAGEPREPGSMGDFEFESDNGKTIAVRRRGAVPDRSTFTWCSGPAPGSVRGRATAGHRAVGKGYLVLIEPRTTDLGSVG
jgi:hypothetical protein